MTLKENYDTALQSGGADHVEVFGEAVTYKPHGGSDRSIDAIVERSDNRPVSPVSQGRGPWITVEAINDVTTGITAEELTPLKDKIVLAVKAGSTTTYERTIGNIIHQDKGTIVFEVN